MDTARHGDRGGRYRGGRDAFPRGRGRGRGGRGPRGGREANFRHTIDNPGSHGSGYGHQDFGNQTRGPRVVRPLGYKTLEQLLEKEPDEAAVELGSLKLGLEKLLESTDVRYDVISLIFQVLNHVCQAHGSSQTINMLLDMFGRCHFLSRHLSRHLIAMRGERNRNRLRIMPRCILDIAKVLSEIQQRLSSYRDEVEVAATLLEDVIRYTEEKAIIVEDRIREEVKQLKDFQASIKKEKNKHSQQHSEPTEPPPNNFRDVSIFPTSEELSETSIPIYLRANIKEGKYSNADHYLDVQFRLLREDFVRPLREGISEYKQDIARPGRQSKRFQDLRLYYDVTLEEPLYTQSGVTFRIHFDETRLKNVRWQSTKRLIFGSLVILSPDNFKSLIFGTVANRKPEDLAKGLIDIKLERDEEIAEIFSDKTFIMAESSAYFEAYRHVLRGLQQVTEETMPLPDYIVSASSSIPPPAYIGQNRTTEYDLSPLVSPNIPNAEKIKERLQFVRVLNSHEWTRLGNTGLDDSQLEAVRVALTQELAVIQGPPGTGKTYIGLKIVHTLLENKQIWQESQLPELNRQTRRSNKPILLVCYTNHALDQFLEGVAEFKSEGIVRVGGRSSSEPLKRFNLNTLRSSRLREDVPRHLRRRIGEVRGEIESLGTEIKLSQDKIHKTKKAVLHERALLNYMTDAQYDSLFRGNVDTSWLVDWLLQDMNLGYHNVVELGQDDQANIPVGNENLPEEREEEHLDILEEAELLEEMRRLDIDDNHAHPEFTDAYGNDDDGSVALSLDDLEFIDRGDGWQQAPQNRRNRKRELQRKLMSNDRMTEMEAAGIRNVWSLRDSGSRWRLYRYWIHKYQHDAHQKLIEKQRRFSNVCQELREARSQEDFEILRQATVIGMTTTGAAKFHTLLQRIQPRIVIVEEAAEVLEAHIVTSLTPSCEHLILIGDHQQLRPNPTVYKLAKNFHLDISLFERMINNFVPYQQLKLQHRMRPEISRLMKMEMLYPDLNDHISVTKFEDIKGVTKNVFFIHHEEKEDSIDEAKSHSNVHEAKFLVALCRYFLQQGYLPDQITILTTYAGQLFNFKNRMNKTDFQGVRVATVDNFQGEENDIILLSLVRSNEEGSAGFLKIDNRICVALSRARKGLYCIGNFKLLAEQNINGPSLWREIVRYLNVTGNIGKTLQLECESHPQTKNKVGKAKDFSNVPEGGCTLPCDARLSCGHRCRMPCHPLDREHKIYKCIQPCTKIICSVGHRCQQRCFNKCDKKCTMKKEKTLPCGHRQQVMCYQNVVDVICTSPCTKTLACGHKCKSTCGEACTVTCEETVFRSDWPCKHTVRVRCSAGPKSCPEPCKAFLSCQHQCAGTCGLCNQGRMHVLCREKCDRTLVCGHPCRASCAADCPPCAQICGNRCHHSKCKKTCGEPCAPCAEPCSWRCKHMVCTKECDQPCSRRPCNKPCPQSLSCSHPCIGLCGEPCPNKCKICDHDEVTEIFFGDEDEPDARFVQLEDCGHVIEVNGLDQWMSIDTGSDGGNTSSPGTVTIQLKGCPRCKTPIRRNLRYGNIIKWALHDIEAVKKKLFGDMAAIDFNRRRLKTELTLEDEMMRMSGIAEEEILFPTNKDARLFLDHVAGTSPLSYGQLTAINNRIQFLKELRNMAKEMRTLRISAKDKAISKKLQDGLAEMKAWLCCGEIMRMTEQEVNDGNKEATRLTLGLKLLKIITQKPMAHEKASGEIESVCISLFNGRALSAEKETDVQNYLNLIMTKSGCLGVSDKERKEILSAMNLAKGHWYKCPNGHIYAIGNCGGANQRGVCPECGSVIGGVNHRLDQGNRVATEMDGARWAAWSEQANLENFDLRDIN